MGKKRFFKTAVSTVLAVSLAIGGVPSAGNLFAEEVQAAVTDYGKAPKYDPVVEWNFDDATETEWAEHGWTTAEIKDTDIRVENQMLKVTQDYTSCTGTFNRGGAGITLSGADYSKMTTISFELYCKEGEAPNQVEAIVQTSSAGADNKNFQRLYTGSVSAYKDAATVTINEESYNKYNMSFSLSDNETDKTAREETTGLILSLVRTDSSFNGTVYLDNIIVHGAESEAKAVIQTAPAVYNEAVTVATENISDPATEWQWYKAASYTAEGEEISGGNAESYTPQNSDLGGWIYCDVVAGGYRYTSNRVRVVGSELKETSIEINSTTISDGIANIQNTTTCYGKFDQSRMAKGGYFYVEYEGEVTGTPQFKLNTWNTAKSPVCIAATETGAKENVKYAKYSYDACVDAWGDENFDDLKALCLVYEGSDSANITITKVSWFGPILSYGEMGQNISFNGSGQFWTKHVGGELDVTAMTEDSYFYVEYSGDADAVELVVQSHSSLSSASGQRYYTISDPETGTTGSGYYSKFTGAQIKEAFGTDFRNIDEFRVYTKSGKTAGSKALYYFQGSGSKIDDLQSDIDAGTLTDFNGDGETDVRDVAWERYEDVEDGGVVVIGASITQNPLVTPLALSGSPIYNERGGWNAVLDRTDCITYGIGSQTTTNVSSRFKEVFRHNPSKIIIQCGNNDSAVSNAVELQTTNYTTMFDAVKAYNQAHKDHQIQVYSIQLNPTKSSRPEDVQKVNAAIDELAAKYDFVTRIKIYDDFKDATDTASTHSYTSLVMSDGLHPVAAGYKIWAQKLKKEMASTDASDVSLTTLSYRTSDTTKKIAVTGFKSENTDKTTFDVELPLGTDANATVQLFETTSNLNAAVTVNGGTELQTASYQDENGKDIYSYIDDETSYVQDRYIPVTLSGGKATVTFTVTAADGKAKKKYTVKFVTKDSVEDITLEGAYSATFTETNVRDWSGCVECPINSADTMYAGTKVEYDLTLEHKNFTSLPIYTCFNWDIIGESKFVSSDFDDNNQIHVEATYIGEPYANLTDIRVKMASNVPDYLGKMTVSNLKITPAVPDTGADAENLVTSVIFEGSERVVTDTPKSFTVQDRFDMDKVIEGGYFYAEYQADSQADIKLAFSDWESSAWKEALSTESGQTESGTYYKKFSYASCLNQWKSTGVGFDEVDAVSVKTVDKEITLTRLEWRGPALADDGATVLYKGSKTGTGAQGQMYYLYTKHVGGTFDTSTINKGSYFELIHTGDAGKVALALSSNSGAKTEWTLIAPSETKAVEGSTTKYRSIFSIEDCINGNISGRSGFGTNFKRLDQITVYTYGDDATKVTMKSLKYFKGNGAVIDQNGTDQWTNKQKTGIALIGDSIVHNPLVNHEASLGEYGGGDWNAILDRQDCSNWGIGGQTTVHISNRIHDILEGDFNYSTIIIWCGINDLGAGVTEEETLSNYKKMFDEIKQKRPGTKVISISVLPTTEKWYGEEGKTKIASINTKLEELTSQDAYKDFVTYVDCYSKLKDASTGFANGDFFFDGLHPNKAGYRIVAGEIYNLLPEETVSLKNCDTQILFEETAGTEPVTIDTKTPYNINDFSVSSIKKGGFLYVEYQSDSQADIRLDLGNGHVIRASYAGEVKGETAKSGTKTFYAKFTYWACDHEMDEKIADINQFQLIAEGSGTASLSKIMWCNPKSISSENGGTGGSSGNTNSTSGNINNTSGDTNGSSGTQTGSDTKNTIKKNDTVTAGGKNFVVTKGGKSGQAEVAFVETSADAKKVVIPKTVVIDGVTCKVTSIAAEAFKGNKKLTSVTIGNNVIKIGEEAFANCTSLKKIVIPASVKVIGKKAFYGCKKMTTVTVGRKVMTIGTSAFEKCTSLKKVVILGAVKKIDSKAFNGCKSLKNITITSTKLKIVGSNALKGADKNTVINVPDKMIKTYRKLFTAKTGFKKTMKLV